LPCIDRPVFRNGALAGGQQSRSVTGADLSTVGARGRCPNGGHGWLSQVVMMSPTSVRAWGGSSSPQPALDRPDMLRVVRMDRFVEESSEGQKPKSETCLLQEDASVSYATLFLGLVILLASVAVAAAQNQPSTSRASRPISRLHAVGPAATVVQTDEVFGRSTEGGAGRGTGFGRGATAGGIVGRG
jgi:hypothetical protein